MAKLPERRGDRLPGRPPEPGQFFDRAHTYGLAHDLERMRAGLAPAPRAPRMPTRRLRSRGGPWASFRRWWASSDRRPVDIWRRARCRAGHHEFRGGGQMQLGSRFVLIERRCAWCDTQQGPSLGQLFGG